MNSKKILIVEDSPETASLMQFILEKDGYKVRIARNGQEGLESAKENAPDLIIMDIMMPQMDGFTLNRTLKASPATENIPVIVISARGLLYKLFGPEKENRIEGYISKPFAPADLINIVQKHIGSSEKK